MSATQRLNRGNMRSDGTIRRRIPGDKNVRLRFAENQNHRTVQFSQLETQGFTLEALAGRVHEPFLIQQAFEGYFKRSGNQ